jgi:GNAT superfamily N-acetyltransferase
MFQFLPLYTAWNTSCIGEGTKIKSWQLQFLGTSPEHQKKGLAGALIQAVESKVLYAFTDHTSLLCL